MLIIFNNPQLGDAEVDREHPEEINPCYNGKGRESYS